MSKASETQIGGTHYKDMGEHQPWDVLQTWLTPEEYRGYQKGVAITYLARERSKGGDQDIGKAIHHLQRLAETFVEPKTQQPESEGWIEWHGGACPVAKGTLVDVQYSDGQTAIGIPALEISGQPRSAVVWMHYDDPSNIIRYRLHKTHPQPTPNPLVTDSEMDALMGGAQEKESQQLAGYGPWFVLDQGFNEQPPQAKGKSGAVIFGDGASHARANLDLLDWTIPAGRLGRITAYCIAEYQPNDSAT